MSPDEAVAPGEDGDWPLGRPAIHYQVCGACRHVWYFRRTFCPACGRTEVQTRRACGHGTVYALTTVNRAPSEALRALAPYRIVIVEADEGFRLMAHGGEGLSIGDRVTARFEPFATLLIPLFNRMATPP